ncbi:hypothetical protein A3D06_01035 [Candidatus Roizmanbacteria bacterium RIFCSPHIGHO2_02_FULL_40_9]|uniref:Uncharacterized protein n=2 Tax=Candidatus Roizmaniibacteriota TaxID=1752723 RepID=A0A1F7IPV7_9BACT|nr:MAG: hypothetical protein A3D06_01035 [Candidatus Roizmanbacteria bacterium RIFCSPHIGHO2_02_FULL_40_9]OGK45322.1 MAG: hypothetical protein A2957_02325 [Candidatus Roizmanbacteria bacterium RIFCSPLOWO2_01_FULL_38_11]
MTRERETDVDLSAVTREQVLAAIQDNRVSLGFQHLIEKLLEDPTTDITSKIIAALVRLENESCPDLPGQTERIGTIATVRAAIAEWVSIIERPDVVSIQGSDPLGEYGKPDEGPQEQLTMDDLGQLVEE